MFENTPLYSESWNVAFRKKSVGTILEDKETVFTVIKNNFRYWAADPFVVEVNGQTYIFAELYDYFLRKGVLGYCKIQDGKATKWNAVIQEKHHMSYPCIMKKGKNIYLMPETGDANEVAVYQALNFPQNWKKIKVLREQVKYADTTPFKISNLSIALTHDVEKPEEPKLTLIDLEDNKRDMVITQSAPFKSRPAGDFFSVKNKLVRPAQYSEGCGNGYGKGLIFYECQLNDKLEYSENEILQIFPESLKYDCNIILDGMHTYNGNDQYEVIDIKTKRFNVLNLFMRIISKFMR